MGILDKDDRCLVSTRWVDERLPSPIAEDQYVWRYLHCTACMRWVPVCHQEKPGDVICPCGRVVGRIIC